LGCAYAQKSPAVIKVEIEIEVEVKRLMIG
jgi:hypothetical protein